MLSGYGWAPERGEPIGSVTQKNPECFESQQVKIWCGLTQWSIQPKSVVVYDPDYVQVLTNTAHGAVEPERLEAIQANFKAAFPRTERHIFPISSWKHESVEHWTLLVLEAKTKMVRYYETLDKQKKANFEAAAVILQILEFEGKLGRANQVRQLAVECGEAICHYVELEVRQAAAEGWGSVRGFTPQRRREMRSKLGVACTNLQKVQADFKERVQKEEREFEKVERLKDAALGKVQRMRKEIEAIKAVQAAQAADSFSEGADVELVLPPGFAEGEKAKKRQAKPQDPKEFKNMLEKEAVAKKKKDEEEAEKKKTEEKEPEEKGKKPAKKDEKETEKKTKNEEEETEKKKKKKIEEEEAEKKKKKKIEEEEAKKKEKKIEEGDVVVVEKEVSELEYKASELLRKGEKGFEKWLKGLSVERLEEIVTEPQGGGDEDPAWKKYLEWVKEHETIKVCSNCRWYHGCETCSYEHALRYVVRHRKPAKWWLRRVGEIFRAKCSKG